MYISRTVKRRNKQADAPSVFSNLRRFFDGMAQASSIMYRLLIVSLLCVPTVALQQIRPSVPNNALLSSLSSISVHQRQLHIRGGCKHKVAGPRESLVLGWQERAAAAGGNRALAFKSRLEVSLAVSFQLLAEIERRRGSFFAEADYVLAGVLTAVVGKAYAAWSTAPTVATGSGGKEGDKSGVMWNDVPTNFFAYGDYSITQRSLAVAKPVPKLFIVGGAAAFVGYGLAALLSSLRPPGEAPPLSPVPLLGAALYGGLFLMSISNLSFQVYQGFIEGRIIDPATASIQKRAGASRPLLDAFAGCLKWLLVAFGRAARGTIVSGLAIRGMQISGLQQRSPGAM